MLAVCLCFSLGACSGGEASGYRIVTTMGGEELCVAFREGDQLKDIITGGMMVLAADSTMAQLSTKWLGENVSIMPADGEMAGWLQNQPHRRLTVGYYEGARPMCYNENGVMQGFDVDMFTELCSRLGWELKFQPIPRGDADVELASGNVDCVAGGFGSAEETKGLSLSSTYLSTEYAIVSKASSGINRLGELKDKTLATIGSSTMGKALEEDTALMEKLGKLMVLNSEDECFTALDAGMCDAILVSSLCAEAHMK